MGVGSGGSVLFWPIILHSVIVVDVVVANQQAELPRQRKKVFPFRTICMGGASIIPLVLPPLLITVTLSCLVSGFLRVCANVYCNPTRTVGFDCSVLFPYCLHVCVEHTLVSTKPNMVSLDLYDDVTEIPVQNTPRIKTRDSPPKLAKRHTFKNIIT
jgi:hypothetical protein